VQSRPRRARSAPEKLEFAWEPFHRVIEEALPLLKRHYEELGLDEPFDPDWRSLMFMERNGRLVIATMRVDGRLVGYCGGLLINYLASQSYRVVMVNALYIEDTYRGPLGHVREFLAMMTAFAHEHKASGLEMGPQGRHRRGIGRLLVKLGWKLSPEPSWRISV